TPPAPVRRYVVHLELRSFPTRRSSDLNGYPIAPRSALDHGEHIRLAQDQVLLVPDRDLRAAVLPVQDPVALLELGLDALAILGRSEEHTSELQSRENLVCRLLLEKKNS